jgi:hypothetical protein
VGLPAYLLGNQGSKDAMLLPERVIFQFHPTIQPFKR